MKKNMIKEYLLKHRENFLNDLVVKEAQVAELPEDQTNVASVDDSIDSFIMSAEKSAQEIKENQNESYVRRLTRLTDQLTEQEDTAVDDEDPAMDVHFFAKEVARLIHNYDNLLDIPSVIVNRALNMLAENYDNTTINTFKEILSENFDIELLMLDQTFETSDEDLGHSAPAAMGAGPISTGGS